MPTTRWFKYHKGATAKIVTLPDLTLSKNTFTDTAVVGSTLATIIGADPRATITTTDNRVAISNNNQRLLRGLGTWSDGSSTLVLNQVLAHATNTPHSTTLNITIAASSGGTYITPGITTYRSWAIDDETLLTQQGSSTDYGYGSKAVGIWVNGMYDTFTDSYRVGVAAWKGSTLSNYQAGDLRGILKVEFSANNGPWLSITTPTTDTGTGREAYWADLRGSDFDHSQTIEVRARIWPKVGKPIILQGRSAVGPPGQSPTYELDAGPVVPLWNGSAFVNTACAIDPRVWNSGPGNGGGISNTIASMHTGWSLVCNVDTADGLMPGLDMYIDPAAGNDANDGLTTATAFRTMDAIVAKAPAKMASLFGTINDGHGNAWADCGGLRINLLGNLNHSTGCSIQQPMLGAANQMITVRVAPGVSRSAVKVTGMGAYPFFAEKIRYLGIDFYGAGIYKDDNSTDSNKRYGDMRIEDCTFDFGPNLITQSTPIADRSFFYAATIGSGGSGYTSPTITCSQGTGCTFTPTVVGGVITNIDVGPKDGSGNFIATAVGYVDGTALTITDSTGTGATATMSMGDWGVYVYDGGSNYTAPTITGSGGVGAVFGAVVTNGKISYITVNMQGVTTPYTNPTYLTITDSTGSGARAILTKGVGYTGNITNGGSGYTTPPGVTLTTGSIPGTTLTSTIAGGKVTSVIGFNTDSTTTCTEGTSFVFTGGGGTGATGTIHVVYGNAPGGGADGTGNNAVVYVNNTVRGHFEIIDPPGKVVPTFTRCGALGFAQTLTLLRNTWIDNVSSAADLVGGAKGMLGLTVTNCREFQVPGTSQADGNHFDIAQPYNAMWNIVYEDINDLTNCNLQGFFCDNNAPITNGAFIRPRLNSGSPLSAQQAAFGAGVDNMLVLDPVVDSPRSFDTPVPANDMRFIMSSNASFWGGSSYQGNEYTAHKGISFIYPGSPGEPVITPTASKFDTIVAPTKIYESLDATQAGTLGVIRYGTSTRTDDRVYYWRDPRNMPRAAQTITALTLANPGVFTANGHGFTTNNHQVQISGVNVAGANGNWFVQVLDANTFSLADMSGTAYSSSGGATYSGGGLVVEAPIQYQMLDIPTVANTVNNQRDIRRPAYLPTGLNGSPCVSFNVGLVGINDTVTYPYPAYIDQALGSNGYGPYGALQHEVWHCGALDHSASDTTNRSLWAWGYNNAPMDFFRSKSGSNQLLNVTMGGYNGNAYTSATASSNASFGSITGPFVARIQALTNGVTLTLYNNANPTGMSWTANLTSGYTKSVGQNGGGLGGRCVSIGVGDAGTFTQQRLNSRVITQPLSNTEVSAMVTEFRTRLSF